MATAIVTSKGQITIPKDLREALGLRQEDMLSITLAAGKLEIEPVKATPRSGGSAWAKELYQLFAPTRKSLAQHTEQAIDKAIDAAVKEARRKRR